MRDSGARPAIVHFNGSRDDSDMVAWASFFGAVQAALFQKSKRIQNARPGETFFGMRFLKEAAMIDSRRTLHLRILQKSGRRWTRAGIAAALAPQSASPRADAATSRGTASTRGAHGGQAGTYSTTRLRCFDYHRLW